MIIHTSAHKSLRQYALTTTQAGNPDRPLESGVRDVVDSVSLGTTLGSSPYLPMAQKGSALGFTSNGLVKRMRLLLDDDSRKVTVTGAAMRNGARQAALGQGFGAAGGGTVVLGHLLSSAR